MRLDSRLIDSRLIVKNLTAGYGNKIVIKNINFEIPPGRLCALLGLNGSGKTTLLKAMLGLIPISGGSCVVDGINCSTLSEYKRARYISYIPQRHSKLLGVSVMDVVMMGFYSTLGPLGFPTATQKQQAAKAIENIGLDFLAHEDFSRLSEGQKQMVILARTLIQDTPVLLLDEPDSALDFLNRRKMLTEVRNMIQKEGKAGIVTLHDPGLALAYCDHIFLIKNGELAGDCDILEADVDEIKKHLSRIYEDITVLEYNNRCFVVP